MVAGFYADTIEIDPEAAKKGFKGDPIGVLDQVAAKLAALPAFDHVTLEAAFQELIESTGLGLGKLAQPTRTALTGRKVSPGIYDVLAVLGRERSLARIEAAQKWVQEHPNSPA